MTYDIVHAEDRVYVSGTAATAEMDFQNNEVRLCERIVDEGDELFLGTGAWIVPRDFTSFFRLAALIADGEVDPP